jgi:DHA2 family multidrug resistance protein-like MFS transporter
MSQPSKAGRREWIGLAVIALPCLVYSMDLTVLNLALPALSADLNPSSVQLLWIVDIYGFLVAGALLTMGTLGDRIGRRKLLLIGAAVFLVASVIAAYSTSAEMLIVMRALLGIAGATLAPSTLSLIRNMFHDPQQRTFAIGVWISSYSAGAAVGPLLGGILLEFFWWGSVFLLAVPVMALLLAVGPTLLPEYKDPQAGSLHIPSAALSLVAMLLLIYGLKQTAQDGFGWLPSLAVVVSLALWTLFVQIQRRLDDPLIDLRLFQTRAFSAALVIYTAGTFVAFGIFIFVNLYLQVGLGKSALEAGLCILPFALGFVVGSMLSPRLVRSMQPATAMAGGLVIAAVGYLLLTQVSSWPGAGIAIVGMLLQAIGLSPLFTLCNDIVIGSAPPERAGAAAGISETGSELGGALGIAIMGSLVTAVYGSAFAPETLAKAVELTAAISAAMVIVMAVAIMSVLRPARAAA